jgi:hypothetical protein
LLFGFSKREKSKGAFLNAGTMCSSSGMSLVYDTHKNRKPLPVNN